MVNPQIIEKNVSFYTTQNNPYKEIKKKLSIELILNIAIFIVGLGTFIATVWVTKVAQNFSEKQSVRSEYIEFLSKTNDYLADRWSENSTLIASLYIEAEKNQTLFEHAINSEERLQALHNYRKKEQEIEMALQYNKNLFDSLQKVLQLHQISEYQNNTFQKLIDQENSLLFIKSLNKVLYHITNNSFHLSENELALLIQKYIKMYHLNTQHLSSYQETIHGEHLATFYNLRAFSRIKKATSNDHFLHCPKILQSIIEEDCKNASLLDPKNFNTYLHMAFAYMKLYATTQNQTLQEQYLTKMEHNIFKAKAIAPLDPSVLIGLGLYYITTEKDLLALSYFKAAHLLLPKNTLILYNMTKIFFNLGQNKNKTDLLETAFSYAKKAISIKPIHNLEMMCLYVGIALSLKKYKEAHDAYENIKTTCSAEPGLCKQNKNIEKIKEIMRYPRRNKILK